MKMNKRALSIGLLTVMIASLGVVWMANDATAQRKMRIFGREKVAPAFMGMMQNHIRGEIKDKLSELDLSDEQIEQLKALREDKKETRKPYIENIQEARKALKAAVIATPPDEAAIRAASANLGAAIGEGTVFLSQSLEELRGILTEEQIELVLTFVEERRSKRQELREKFQEFFGEILNEM